VKISFKPGSSSQFVKSSFGYGVLTWYLPYVFRTPPGYNLLVRGPLNYAKDGIAPLDGLVETDWAVATFSMNWRFTRPFHKVKFERDEPICAIIPQRRGELESFVPEIRNLDGELREEFQRWLESRQHHAVDHAKHPGNRDQQGHYTRGETVAGKKAFEHQTKLAVAPFVEREPPPAVVTGGPAGRPSEVPSGTAAGGSFRRWLAKVLPKI